MKKFFMCVFGFLFRVTGLIGLVTIGAALLGGEDISGTMFIVALVCLIPGIIGLIFGSKTKYMCWCGKQGRIVDSEFLGTDVHHSSTENSYTKRFTKKYRLYLECSCGRTWTKNASKEGPKETHYY